MHRGVAPDAWASYDPTWLAEPAEVDLIDVLGRLPDVIRVTQETLAVNLLAEYGYELATAFSQFYNRCPILNATPPLDAPLLQARLGLVAATAQAMLAFVRAQRPPYLPAQSSLSRGPDGQQVLSIEFTAPSPLGLLQPPP